MVTLTFFWPASIGIAAFGAGGGGEVIRARVDRRGVVDNGGDVLDVAQAGIAEGCVLLGSGLGVVEGLGTCCGEQGGVVVDIEEIPCRLTEFPAAPAAAVSTCPTWVSG